ncbi:hypothetical protein SUGI_0656840 [Cryptomeria japonica]|uniref:uncharacterized protein LOC131048632 n=1 Tax=Cryptomeria japonica TaxID=3369 RepID=UPI0024148782|nr:uncharacterized protein LOC131048632 [Cryptomeria japonica]XP_057838653.2 uncharacterized protein LOC131048632 [Cryptomeria japonica]XP_057838654.2 uncharacterized protein LOC131048632 [Cryptomeria japonica]XP_059063513.1 uncharacterized protein LOC131048632 [Cryptomeria japonica]GLJ32645.1 hypothetical protein SUGI_0656840 [Cryptomeria japonica]
MAMAGAVMKRRNYSFALRSLNFAFGSLSILPSHSRFALSTLAEKNGSVIHHLENPFAQFASTKFNISSVELARMFKWAPTLQRLQTLDKVEEFVGVLEENGFKQEQIARIMRSIPQYLVSSCKETRNKVQLLKDSGICGEHLVKLLTGRPLILSFSLEQRLIPTVTYLLNLYQSQDLFLKSVFRYMSILTLSVENSLKPSIAFWENYGFRGGELTKLLVLRPNILRCISFTTAQLDLIQKIGVVKESKMYKHVLIFLASTRMTTLEAKIRNFHLCGLSYEETMELLSLSPHVFGLTEKNIRAKMDFMVNNMELPPNSIIKYRKILYVNLDKVLKPRFFVWKKMASMNGFEHFKIKSLLTMLNMREADFLTKILKGHPEAATLLAIYEKGLADASSSSSGTQILRRCWF